MLRRLMSRLRRVIFGARSRRELDEEIAFHLDALTQDLIAQGMDPKEARREARIRFGSTEWVHDRSRQEWGLAVLDETARNVRLAVRGLVRNPMFYATFVLALALCVGLGTAVFSVVDSVLWRPLPFPAPERLANVVLYNPDRGKRPGDTAADGSTWMRFREDGDPLERAVYSGWFRGVNLTTDQSAAFVQQQRVGSGYFRTLGVSPALGREFEPAEDVPNGPPVAILSHALWSNTFGSDPGILGQTIRLKGEAHSVVGIMPESFRSNALADVWTPLRPSTTGEGSGTNYAILVRIPEGMSFEEADARVGTIRPPDRGQNAPAARLGLVPLDAALSAGVRMPMTILMVGVALMLVVGLANLAGLQIARSWARRPEMATRQALGSGTSALVRQVATENVLLGVLGGALGLGLAWYGLSALESLIQSHFGIWQSVRLDARSVAACIALVAVATVVFGLTPVMHVSRTTVLQGPVSGRRVIRASGHVLRKTLLVVQVAMVTVLLFGAGLLLRSYGYLEGLDPGFEPDQVLTVQFSLDDARYAEAANVHDLFEQSLDQIRDIPGVQSAAVALTLPYERPLNLTFRRGVDENPKITNAVYVTPGFFETLSIPVLQGRTFQDSDRADAPIVAVVNQAFVDANLEIGSALGSTFRMGFSRDEDIPVIGVVGNVQQSAGFGDTSQPVWETPTVYVAAAQASSGFLQGIHVWFSPSWVIREAGAPGQVSQQVAEVFRNVAPELPMARTTSLNGILDRAFSQQRFEAAFLLAIALFSLLLAGIGLYGIVAHEVLERRTEMGLRMALGATPAQAVWTTGLSGVRLTGLGMLVGAVVAVGASRLVRSLVWGIEPWDPPTVFALILTLTLLAATASFLPAARIGRLDPARVLSEG